MEEPDDELVRRARDGEGPAFEALVRRHQERIYRLARRICNDERDAEEALQDAFLQAYRNLGGFRGDSAFTTWLHRIAVNAALMRRRARRSEPTESLEEYLPRFEASGMHLGGLEADALARSAVPPADVLVHRRELAERAEEAIARLPEMYRVPFVLRDLQELSTAEVAEVLELEPAAVRQRVHRARLMLRGFLADLAGGFA
jgi:RNA polymerase sigma-70 factor (ECF subfamily)